MLKFSVSLPRRLDFTPAATGGRCIRAVEFLEAEEMPEVVELVVDEPLGVKEAGGVSGVEEPTGDDSELYPARPPPAVIPVPLTFDGSVSEEAVSKASMSEATSEGVLYPTVLPKEMVLTGTA